MRQERTLPGPHRPFNRESSRALRTCVRRKGTMASRVAGGLSVIGQCLLSGSCGRRRTGVASGELDRTYGR